MLVHAPWTGIPGLAHGFLDATECRTADLSDALRAQGLALSLQTPKQVHGARVVLASPLGAREVADGIIVTDAGLAGGVVTADCVPVLIVAREARVAAAVHAGWRGAAAGVIETAVDLIRDRAGRDVGLEAVIGPAIGGCCYQVGSEVRAAFNARVGDRTASAWSPDGERWRLDLRTAVEKLLGAQTVPATQLGPCTFCGAGFNSFRRDGARAGRQLSFVGWRAP
jgi:YfiH family protein